MVIALAFTESSLNYKVKHKGNKAKGICGITDYWIDLLNKKNVKVNSLESCLVVYKELLEQHKNKRDTIKAYKGIESKSNMWIVDKVIEIEEILK